MFSGFVLAFREGLEAALIISIVLGVITRMERRHLIPFRYGWGPQQV